MTHLKLVYSAPEPKPPAKRKPKAPARKKAHPIPGVVDLPTAFDINLAEVVHLTKESDGINLNPDPVVIWGSAEISMRRLITKYGFARLPFTYGEFHGLLDYCAKLDIEFNPGHDEAVQLYSEGNLDALAKLHTDEDTLTALGVSYATPL